MTYEIRTDAPNANNPLYASASLNDALAWLGDVAREQADDDADITLMLVPVPVENAG